MSVLEDEKNKCHWLSWEKLSSVLRRKEVWVFLICIFSTWQCWQEGLQNPDSLCCVVLKAMYFPNTSILEAIPKAGMSYTWRSILGGVELLKEGVIWCVGTGEHIDIDPWIPQGVTRRPCTLNGMDEPMKVAELIDHETCT